MTMKLQQVTRAFAGVLAANAVDLEVPRGQVVGLVGPNGSGKSTIANLASGAVVPDTGRIIIDGADLTGLDAHRFAAAGVVRTFQGLRLFEGLTVIDNVLVGAQRGERPRLRDAWLRTPAVRARNRARGDLARQALRRVGLDGYADHPVGALSHGQRRRVELARAVAARPRYLVLDEPAAGLDPQQVEALAGTIIELRTDRIGLLLIEHDLDLVTALSDTVVPLAQGTIAPAATEVRA